MTDTLQTLLERLQNADGPDREIDTQIAKAFNWTPAGHPEKKPEYWYTDAFGMPHYTASLDSSIELLEKVLPGWEWVRLIGGQVWVYCAAEDGTPIRSGLALDPKTVPLGILIATVQALIAEQE